MKLAALGVVGALAVSSLVATFSSEEAEAAVLVTNAQELKDQIEAATTDLEIELAPGVYTFDLDSGAGEQVKNSQNINITLVGALDDAGEPATEFVMADSVAYGSRFIRAQSASLNLSNIKFTGGVNKNGGVSAFSVSARNTIFEDNSTKDSVAGGGAIKATGGVINIEHSTFLRNSAWGSSDGGAIGTEYGGGLYVNDSVFDGNFRESGGKNQYGGAISVKLPSVAGSTVEIRNSAFLNNVHPAAGNYSTGGAIRVFGGSNLDSVVIDNSLFKGNKTTVSVDQSGGAIGFQDTKKSTITNSTFVDNTSTRYGGAVYYENSPDNTIINSTFVGNVAGPLHGGSALGAYSSNVVVDSSTFLNQTFKTNGTNPKITVRDSVRPAAAASATIVYEGDNNVAYSPSLFKVDPATELVKVSDTNYVAPVKVGGGAYKKVDGTRTLDVAQNGVERKSPLSDVGASETPVYTVTFDSAEGSAVDPITDIDDGSLISAPAEPTRDGYTFGGWTLEGAAYNFDEPVTSDLTLVAIWTKNPAATFTVKFNSNGGTAVAAVSVVKGEAVAKPANPTRKGFEFTGWTLNNTSYDFSAPVNSDITLEAMWKAGTTAEEVDLKITPATLPKGSVGKAYTATVTAKGTGKPVLSLSGGKLPDGLKFDAKTGKITGKPTKTGSFTFTIKAQAGGKSVTKQYMVVIENAAVGPCMEPRKVPVFSDTPLKHKFYKEIDWMECMKYATGWRMPTGKPEYRPQLNIERQAMAAFIFRMDADKSYRAPKVSPFADVKTTDKFYREIAWMWEKGYATGWAEPSGKPTFRSLEPLSREAMAAFIYRLEAAKHPSAKNYQAPAVSPLADMKKGMKFYREISWMYDEKLTTGNKTVTGKEFWPKDQLSRQAMAAFIYRLVTDYRVKN